jgi:hypothetical protein
MLRMDRQREDLHERVDKIEEQSKQEILTLIEILSNITFFGEMKRANCEFAKNNQCTYFVLKKQEKNKLPIVSECRVEDCKEPNPHYHIELSNITCALCQNNIELTVSNLKKYEFKWGLRNV